MRTYIGHDVVQRLEASVVNCFRVLLRRQLGPERLLFLEQLLDLNNGT